MLSIAKTETMRAAVVKAYEARTQETGIGPCGAIAVVLDRMGLGVVASCTVVGHFADGMYTEDFAHYVAVNNDGNVLDIALPPGFRVKRYDDVYPYKFGDTPADELWTEEDYQFWANVLKGTN